MRHAVGLLLVTTVAVALVTSALASPSPSPSAVRHSIVRAALAQKSVHWTSKFSSVGGLQRATGDVSADSAVERLTFPSVGAQVERVKILRVGETEYLKGNVAVLKGYLGLTNAQATQFAGQWISIPSSDPEDGYDNDHEGLNLAAVVRDAVPRGKLTVSRRKSHGTRLLVVHGSTAFVDSKLSAHARSKLPIAYSDGAAGSWTRSRFSKWNESVNVQAPANSTPIATVRGG